MVNEGNPNEQCKYSIIVVWVPPCLALLSPPASCALLSPVSVSLAHATWSESVTARTNKYDGRVPQHRQTCTP